MNKNLQLISRIYLKLLLFSVAIGIITRFILIFNPQTVSIDFGFWNWIGIFLLGVLNDASIITLAFLFLFLFLLSISSWKFSRPWSYICLLVLFGALVYLTCFNTIFDEYGSAAPTVAISLIGFWLLSFGVRCFIPKARVMWTTVWFWTITLIYIGAILFNLVAEVAFWNEFGVRYNFIAVDYLVYTHEVIGNIMESYPMFYIISAWLIVSMVCTWLLFRKNIAGLKSLATDYRWKPWAMSGYIAMFAVALFVLSFNLRFQYTPNIYVNELQANGLHKFYDAFLKNELDYPRFYLTIPEKEADRILASDYGDSLPSSRTVTSENEEIHPNIVLVTLESMSADFLERFGNDRHLTPTLDSLYRHSLAFDSIFATGNRTVRGLEAVTLSLPPCPGQSLVKQENNSGLFSVGSMLRDKGYSTTYFYGGNAYFDNMEEFFSGNGYDIVDSKKYRPEEITFSNIWGVCDEDSYNKTLTVLDSISAADRPFFAHIMSVSNHRPFTYPDGKISVPNDSKSREGGVMYSDYALGRFLENARDKEWFDNTVFVITADHCASSAGRTEIPLGKYHIPALIYSPGLIEPQSVTTVASQIDIMPTLFSRLGMDYRSEFYGKDILDSEFNPRAFIATYQDLGYLDGDILTILSPVRRVKQYRRVPTPDDPFNLVELERPDTTLVNRAIAYYQQSSPRRR